MFHVKPLISRKKYTLPTVKNVLLFYVMDVYDMMLIVMILMMTHSETLKNDLTVELQDVLSSLI